MSFIFTGLCFASVWTLLGNAHLGVFMNYTRCDGLPYRVCTERKHRGYDATLWDWTSEEDSDKHFVVGVAEYPPYSYESPPGSLCFCGLTITLLSHIADSLNLRLVLLPERNPVLYNTSYDGPPFDVLSGRVAMSVCPLGITPARLSDFDLLSIYTARTYQIAIHKSLLIEGGTESLLRGIVDSFDLYSWIGIVGVSLWIFAVLWWANALDFRLKQPADVGDRSRVVVIKGTFRKTYWEFFYSCISQADLRRSNHVTAYNYLIIVWLLWVLVIFFTIITASLTATLSINPASLPFDSPESFLQSDFTLISRPLDPFQSSTTQDFTSKTVIYNANNSDAYLYDIAAHASNRHKAAVSCIFVDSSGCSDRGLVGAFDLGVKRWVSLMQLRKSTSTIPDIINKRLLRLMQGGLTERQMEVHRLISYRDKEAAIKPTGNHYNDRKGIAYVITNARLKRIFYCSAGLLMLSAAVFLYEIKFLR